MKAARSSGRSANVTNSISDDGGYGNSNKRKTNIRSPTTAIPNNGGVTRQGTNIRNIRNKRTSDSTKPR